MNSINTRLFIVFMVLSVLVQPLRGHASAIDLLEWINTRNESLNKPSADALPKNKKLKQSQNKLRAVKKLYAQAKLIASKHIKYVFNAKTLSAKNLSYGVAGLASLVFAAHAYHYMLDLGRLEKPYYQEENPTVLVDDLPCPPPVVQADTELPDQQTPDNSEQSKDEKEEPHIDQQEPVQTDTSATDEVGKTEELTRQDTQQDMQENNQELIDPTEKSHNSDRTSLDVIAGSAVVVTTIVTACLLAQYGDEIINAIISKIL